ncbi:zinc finger protein 771 [Drosophila erecta]|uniref:Protein krueppel n=1 Tax=Drosophila erecta TaxID=7220 RepID=B3NAR6_DROER|nr:zinc finger protein 771 [Drosophila erecta]XP_026835063.1 zinc finger protein 771 [Drosophila erecta]EDV57589.1 uncharacterized protein Dere_GG24456 [Drosophila erecta]
MENKCRVCLADSKNLVNIFEERQDLRISIAHMISKCTGFKVEKGDSFPPSICPACLQDVHSAFAIIKTYERSYQVFCEVQDTVLEEDEIIELSDSDEVVSIKEGEEEGHSRRTTAAADEKAAQEEVKGDHFEEVGGHKTHVCTQCHLSYESPDLLELHSLRHYTSEGPSPRSLADNNELKMHTSTHAGKKVMRKNARQLTRTLAYKCIYCYKSFSSPSSCRRHYKRHTGERPYACGTCQKPFADAASVKRHMRIHTGERPYKCPTCQSTFTDSSSFRQHSRIHTGEKPFKCDLCEKFFRERSDARKHRRSHTGEKRFQCSLCKRAFCQIHSLRRHLELNHVDQDKSQA